jgi:hypothetical protein
MYKSVVRLQLASGGYECDRVFMGCGISLNIWSFPKYYKVFEKE